MKIKKELIKREIAGDTILVPVGKTVYDANGLFVLNELLGFVAGGLSFLLHIGFGIVGNYLYMKDINNRTDKALDMQPEEREAFIQKNSGTSWIPVIVIAAVSVALGFMMV